MVKTYIPPDDREVICPSCGAEIKTPPSPRSRRVQCPKCREVVVIESTPESEAGKKKRQERTPDTGSDQSRIEMLEARVAALEAALTGMSATKPDVDRVIEKRKLQWVAGAADATQEFSAERGRALAHNLGTVKTREITIRTPAGDRTAGERAVWFKEVFERAGWTVRGPEPIAPEAAGAALELAVPELPVAKEAAETYLALKAAGFEPIAVLDPALASGTETSPLSLTLPAKKAA